jgi:Bifunctional DNA primase/polymerase, N-terminal
MNPCGHSWSVPAGGEVSRIGFGVMALRYASWGYAVLPCERGGKKPHRMLPPEGGVHWACTDPAQIRQWWSEDPAAGIGVATGAPSALAVIDLDVKGEHNGLESLSRFLSGFSSGDALASCPAARTPSGGWHLWLRLPWGWRSPERPGILPGVDVKGDGGYVLAAPSARLVMPLGADGERVEPVPVPYVWDAGCPCTAALAPPWLNAWLASAPQQQQARAGDPPPELDELRRTGIPAGERNHTIYRLACSLFRKYGTTPKGAAVVLGELGEVWQASDRRDFGWREVLVCAESARKFIERTQQQERMALTAWRNRA